MKIIAQAAIILFSCLSIWLLSRKHAGIRRWGYIAGLAGQPFWIYAALDSGQWGVFGVSLWFTYCHLSGIHTHWIRT